jgi:hypothetical protein
MTKLTGNFRRAKIKLLAKKSIETGEDCDAIPESMRQYLAIQAMESGKSLGGNFLGRSGLMPYGSGSLMMGGDQGPQGKVGRFSPSRLTPHDRLLTHCDSHPPSFVSIIEHRIMETRRTECDGSHHLLFAREGLYDLLH